MLALGCVLISYAQQKEISGTVSSDDGSPLAGATITGDGVSAMLKKDIAMYVPYFKTLNN